MSGSVHGCVRLLVTATGRLAQFCDRAEHNEASDRSVIIAVGASLRAAAWNLLADSGVDPVDAYATRLGEIERRSPVAGIGVFDAEDYVRLAKTWRELQRCQALHDGTYHPDVNGLAKLDQLRHYTQHLGKLAWYFQDEVDGTGREHDVTVARTTDILVFGVKLATVCGQLLPDQPVGVCLVP